MPGEFKLRIKVRTFSRHLMFLPISLSKILIRNIILYLKKYAKLATCQCQGSVQCRQ